MNFKLSYKEKSRILNVRQVKGLAMGIGLTFKSRNTEILLFDFGKLTRLSITSFFVFFPFLAVWLDGKNRVIEKRVVQPFQFRIAPKKGFRRQ